MNKLFPLALFLSLGLYAVGGCQKKAETKVESNETVSTPGGETTTHSEQTTTEKGDAPPAKP